MIINKSYLACFYYNLEKPNRYNIEDYKDRQLARKNFANSKNTDRDRLKWALEEYKKSLDKDFENMLNSSDS